MAPHIEIESSDPIRDISDSILVPFKLALIGTSVRIKHGVHISRSSLTSPIHGRDSNIPFSKIELTAIARLYLEDALRSGYAPADGGHLDLCDQRQFSEIASRVLTLKESL